MKYIKLFEQHKPKYVPSTFDEFVQFIILQFKSFGPTVNFVPEVDYENDIVNIIVDNETSEIDGISNLIYNMENTKEYEYYYIDAKYDDTITIFRFRFIQSSSSLN